MNIGFDAKRAFSNRSGLGNYSRSTIEILMKYFPKNDYFLYTPNDNSDLFLNINNAKIIKPSNFFQKSLKSYWRSFTVSKLIKNNKLDIYHGLSNELPQNIHKTGVKSLVTIHDLIFIRYPELYNAFDRKIYNKKTKYACQNADTVIAISEQTKSDLVNYLGVDEKKIEIVYQTCHTQFGKTADAETKTKVRKKYNLPENFVLYVGTIEKRKNALNIVKAINEHKIDIPIVIIGKKTDYQQDIEKYITKNNMNKSVFILNGLPFKDLPTIYQLAEMFIYPSIFEGFGIPIIEALNSKIPVITTKGGCFSEAGGMSSLYVSHENTEELGEAIKKIISNTDLRNKIIKEGYEYVQKFSEKNVSKNLMDIYLK